MVYHVRTCIWPEFINCKDCIFKAGRSGHDLKYLHGNTKKRFIAWSVCNLPTFQLRIKCVSLLDTYVCMPLGPTVPY